ncbi:molybdopterin-dependent oxidoreductase [Stappia stellulata]|uniref:molybdopterin-dependent oxidoreductase n=1 Tax=Stappia stellulata TaxID=71235 RepID=UPI0003F8807C|nr:molybdopterin-dependent oxidoreductase [Stappia stellulata]
MGRRTGKTTARLRALALGAVVALFGAVAGMAGAAAETSAVFRIDGNIDSAVPLQLTRADLEAIGMHDVVTVTPWNDELTTYTGPLIRDVLAHVGAKGDSIVAVALNNYRVVFPVSDTRDYDVILAVRVNGEPIGLRQRGPVRVIYPWSEREELRSEVYYSRAIWQMNGMTVVGQASQ